MYLSSDIYAILAMWKYSFPSNIPFVGKSSLLTFTFCFYFNVILFVSADSQILAFVLFISLNKHILRSYL
jgi:hypothetical protein